MSIAQFLPRSSKPLFVKAKFDATFNVPTLGVYDFAVAANAGVTLLDLVGSVAYFIDQIDVGVTVAPAAFQEALDPTTPLTLQLNLKKDGAPVPDNPITINQLYTNKELNAFFRTNSKGSDQLQATFRGRLLQPAALIGTPTISMNINISIWYISDTNFINSYLKDWAQGLPVFQTEKFSRR